MDSYSEGVTIARALVILMSLVSFGQAQNGAVIVSSGYDRTSGLTVAPGQILRLKVAGLDISPGGSLTRRYASTLPLPEQLAGFSVGVSQRVGLKTGPLLSAPLIAVEQTIICSELKDYGDLPDCYITVLTVQMPFDLVPLSFPDPIPVTRLVVTKDGRSSVAFSALTLSDQIHVVTTCDSLSARDSLCTPAVTHSDGTLVSEEAPARAGEALTIYAWGLGVTDRPVRTGSETPQSYFACGRTDLYRFRFPSKCRVGSASV